jgi:hypothetical protein
MPSPGIAPPNILQRSRVMGKRMVEDSLGKMMVKREEFVYVAGKKIEYEIKKV